MSDQAASFEGIAEYVRLTPTGEAIQSITWSPDGRLLALLDKSGTIVLWDIVAWRPKARFQVEKASPPLRWSPNGQWLGFIMNRKIEIWDISTSTPIRQEAAFFTILIWEEVSDLAWSPDGKILAISLLDNKDWTQANTEANTKLVLVNVGDWVLHSLGQIGIKNSDLSLAWLPKSQHLVFVSDEDVRFWSVAERAISGRLPGIGESVIAVAVSPNGRLLATGSESGQIRVWDLREEREGLVLEGHSLPVRGLSFSADGRLLAARDYKKASIWQISSDNGWAASLIGTQSEAHDSDMPDWLFEWNTESVTGPTFHPRAPILATLDSKDPAIVRIWKLDTAKIFGESPRISASYANAKVVLLGDSGVGKSGLGLVLSGQLYRETESTHGRQVWTLESQEIDLGEGHRETRETLLWDLAGQPGYRLIHQLHLNEVAVALVVFDSRSETDPFAGVRHWDRALRQAQQVYGGNTPLKKFLVAARADRGGIGVSRERIEALVRDLGFEGYFATSAREGWQIADLAAALRAAIPWDGLPRVVSTELFQRIKDFLVEEKKSGRLLSTSDDLYAAFCRSAGAPAASDELRAQFETCIGRVEARDLIRRLSFGGLVLLQPERLDAYASAIVHAARDEPDGLGSMAEEIVRAGRFRMSDDERIADKTREGLLLIATVEDMLRHEIALREKADDGAYLIFPSQLTRERADLPDPQGKEVILAFEGPVLSIYATLAVRLAHSGIFSRDELWKNAATYRGKLGGLCGMYLREVKEGRGELTLFFSADTSEETRFHFEEYIGAHLGRKSLPGSVERRRIFVCPDCGTAVTDQQATRRRERSFDWIGCAVCDTRIDLRDRVERLEAPASPLVEAMDRAADAQRDRAAAVSVIEGKHATGDYDVLLAHAGPDQAVVLQIGKWLREVGILPWFSIWNLPPGRALQTELEARIAQIRSAAIFIGPNGRGPWQDVDQEAILREFVRRKCPVIPVLLPGAPDEPELPIFLKGMARVDFRLLEGNPFERLVWGITGERRSIAQEPPDLTGASAALAPATMRDQAKESLHRRLQYYRGTLATYLEQLAISGAANVRPEVNAGIAEARSAIRQLKSRLRAAGAEVEDWPDDEE